MNNVLKRFASVSVILIIMFGTFFIPYSERYPVYADATEDQYAYINNKSDAIAAIQAYLNARGLGVLSDSLTAADEWFINQQIELQDLFSGVEKTTGGILKFRYDAVVLQKLNSFVGDLYQKYNFAEFNEENQEQTSIAYSGNVFTDADGNSCLVYYVNNVSTLPTSINNLVAMGTPYKYTSSQLKNIFSNGQNSVSFKLTDSYTATRNFYSGTYQGDTWLAYENTSDRFIAGLNFNTSAYGNYGILRISNQYWFGAINPLMCVFRYNNTPTIDTSLFCYEKYVLVGNSLPPANISIHTPKGYLPDPPEPFEPIIPKDSQGNTYNYDNSQTYIDNSVTNNTTYYYTTDPDPDPDPEPDVPGITDPDNWSPSIWEVPDFSNFNFALPATLQNKWPWCIPWDLLTIMTIFVDDPETPEIKGPIHFGYGNVFSYTWNVNYDFHQFDDLAAKVRSVFKLIWLIGLSILTAVLFNPN